jgi:DNA-binding MarR family transcriptional regulator
MWDRYDFRSDDRNDSGSWDRSLGSRGGSSDRDRNEERDPRDVFTKDLDLPRGRERRPVRERDRVYGINGAESRMLGTIGAFRVVSESDLNDLRDESSNPRRSIRHLEDEGLIRRSPLSSDDRAVVLTERGRDLLEANRYERPERTYEPRQTFYAGLRKPRELTHDTKVYRAYQRTEERLRAEGGRVRRDTDRRVHVRDDALEIIQIAGEATGETVREEAERLVGRGTVVPGDPHPRRRLARVRAMAREAAAATRMPRTPREPCLLPRAFGNIGLAGQRAWIAQLHRPGGARLPPWRPHPPFPSRSSHGGRGRFYYNSRPPGEFDDGCARPTGVPGSGGGARRHPQTGIGAPLGAAERLKDLQRPPTRSPSRPRQRRLTLRPAIGNSLTGRMREDLSEGLRNYVRANNQAACSLQQGAVLCSLPAEALHRRDGMANQRGDQVVRKVFVKQYAHVS